MKLKIKKLDKNVHIEPKKYPGDAGFDLAVSCDCTIGSRCTTSLPTAIAVEAPEGYFIRITNRSSTYQSFGVFVNEGIVDNGWRGEMNVVVTNPSNEEVYIKKGARIAQMLVHKLHEFELEYVDELSEAERGTNGFGSTGKGNDV